MTAGAGRQQGIKLFSVVAFPGAVGAEKPEELSRRNRKVHVLHGDEVAKAAGQGLRCDGRNIHRFWTLAYSLELQNPRSIGPSGKPRDGPFRSLVLASIDGRNRQC